MCIVQETKKILVVTRTLPIAETYVLVYSLSMLRIENLTFQYGDNEPLLQDVRFDFGDRGIVGIFGISGVGKTTLLKILAGLLYTPTGKVWWGDQDIMQLDKNALYAYRNKTIGFAFQDHHLLGHFTARENIMVPFLFDDSQVDE